jgi:predicted trehalose synthase
MLLVDRQLVLATKKNIVVVALLRVRQMHLNKRAILAVFAKFAMGLDPDLAVVIMLTIVPYVATVLVLEFVIRVAVYLKVNYHLEIVQAVGIPVEELLHVDQN